MSDLASKIESILLVAGDPLSAEKIAKVVKSSPSEVEAALRELSGEYETRGIRLVSDGRAWQFGTAPEHTPLIEELVKSEFGEELSKAAIETIAIVAYKGPITRTEVEYIRGVNSSFTIRNLLLRGLLDRVENPKDARSYLYMVSIEFLKYLGITRREELPEWETWRNFEVPRAYPDKSQL
ncbi:MAG: SMC-Scp complex subunit ScpB [Candidatus Sungbacteria bacterium]|nr:SMC-Scp complex subunit ScpB [Candidatus Sungbacteria bacterium]